MSLLRDGFLRLSENRIARRFATDAPFARTIARRFVAGERLEEAIAAVRPLNQQGMTASLDYLGESVSNREEARRAADVYIAALDRIRAENLDANVSLKLTGMGQDIDESFLRENVGRVLDRAREHDIFVRFDMESSDYTQRTLDFFRRVWEEGYRNVGVVIQSYLYRSEADVQMLNSLGARVRLCKGAYNEPPTVAYPEKKDVDANFVGLMQLLLTDGNYPGIATHDDLMIRATQRFALEKGIPTESYEFQMLYGVRRDYQQQLVREGYRLRIYIPFGEAWYPYFMRRIAERPANMVFIANAILKESPLGVLLPGNNARRQ